MDVEAWLAALGLACYAPYFRANDVDAETLPLLTGDDLAAMGVASVGHRRRILAAAAQEGDGSSIERRILTVMFVDLVESTALLAQLDLEDYLDVIGQFRREVSNVLKAHGGHVSQLLGDGMMASFGYPASTEHAAERAVAAALAAIDASDGHFRDRDGPRMRLRIGVATGLAVVGGGGRASAPGADTAIGETPNLASRLQAAADPGTVLISAPTRRLIGDLFECDDLGDREFKGLSAPVRVWRVRDRSRAATRFEALRAPQRRAPFTGRDHELDLLLAKLAPDAEGRARVVLVSGEPGLGKSRLVRRALALRRSTPSGEALVLQCSPYGMAVPFHPVRYTLLRASDFRSSDAREAIQARISSHLATIGLASPEAPPLLLAFLDPGSATPEAHPPMAPSEARAKLMRTLSDYLVKLAETASALVIEDAHWLDPSTAELLGDLLPRLCASGIPVIATARPDAPVAPCLGGQDVTRIPIDRLPVSDLSALVSAMAGPGRLPPAVLKAIVARSDGVPVFAEELTWGYLEGALPQQLGDDVAQVPPSLAESLLARLDRLSHGRKLASIAAAIGREFPVSVLVAVAGLPEPTVREDLGELIAGGILEPGHSRFGEAVRFRHSLVRDAAYELLLHREHGSLHRRIADTLEQEFPEIAQALPHVLAIQRDHAGQWPEACEAWLRAGQDASRRSAHVEAASSLAKAVEANFRTSPGRERDERELALRLQLLATLASVNGYRYETADIGAAHILSLTTWMAPSVPAAAAIQVCWETLASEGDTTGTIHPAPQTREVKEAPGSPERLGG